MRTLLRIETKLLIALICIGFLACNPNSQEWVTTKEHDFIIDDMAFRITEKGAVLVCVNPDLSGHLEIPDHVTWEANGATYPVIDIQEYGLNQCTRLTSVRVPDAVVDISWVFDGCSSLASVNVPTKANRMVGAFCNCTSLKSIVIPDNVGYIGGAFEGCTNLGEVVLPRNEEFTYILGGTFAGCERLASITIPSHVKSIYRGAFEGCVSLSEVHCQSPQPPAVHEAGNLYRDYFTVSDKLYVPQGSKEIYRSTYPWSEFQTIVEE